MVDGTQKAFALEENDTVERLRAAVIEKIELTEEGCFALFEKRDDYGIFFHPSPPSSHFPFMMISIDKREREMLGAWWKATRIVKWMGSSGEEEGRSRTKDPLQKEDLPSWWR